MKGTNGRISADPASQKSREKKPKQAHPFVQARWLSHCGRGACLHWLVLLTVCTLQENRSVTNIAMPVAKVASLTRSSRLFVWCPLLGCGPRFYTDPAPLTATFFTQSLPCLGTQVILNGCQALPSIAKLVDAKPTYLSLAAQRAAKQPSRSRCRPFAALVRDVWDPSGKTCQRCTPAVNSALPLQRHEATSDTNANIEKHENEIVRNVPMAPITWRPYRAPQRSSGMKWKRCQAPPRAIFSAVCLCGVASVRAASAHAGAMNSTTGAGGTFSRTFGQVSNAGAAPTKVVRVPQLDGGASCRIALSQRFVIGMNGLLMCRCRCQRRSLH